jgi:hypothetical protein
MNTTNNYLNDSEIELIDKLHDIEREQGFSSTWSFYEVTDLSKPHGFSQDEIIYDSYWTYDDKGMISDEPSKPIVVKIEGNTWMDVWRACDKLIINSGDTYHRYIEDVDINERNQLELGTGS